MFYTFPIFKSAFEICPQYVYDQCYEFYSKRFRGNNFHKEFSSEFIWSQTSIPIILYRYLTKPPLKIWFSFQSEICLDYIAKILFDESCPNDLLQPFIPSYEFIPFVEFKTILKRERITTHKKLIVSNGVCPNEFNIDKNIGLIVNIQISKISLQSWPQLVLDTMTKLMRKKSVNIRDFFRLNVKQLKKLLLFNNLSFTGRKLDIQCYIIRNSDFQLINTSTQLENNILKHKNFWKFLELISQPRWKSLQLEFCVNTTSNNSYNNSSNNSSNNSYNNSSNSYNNSSNNTSLQEIVLKYLSDPSSWIIEPETLLMVNNDNISLNGFNTFQQKTDHIIYKLFKFQVGDLLAYYNIKFDNIEDTIKGNLLVHTY